MYKSEKKAFIMAFTSTMIVGVIALTTLFHHHKQTQREQDDVVMPPHYCIEANPGWFYTGNDDITGYSNISCLQAYKNWRVTYLWFPRRWERV